MKTTITERKVAIQVEYTREDLLKLLHFDRGDGVNTQLPPDTLFHWEDSKDVTLTALFDMNLTPPSPSDLNQKEVDVWGLIRQAGDKGITYDRLQHILEDTMARQTIEKVVRSLVHKGLVVACEEGEKSNDGGPPRKLWRSKE